MHPRILARDSSCSGGTCPAVYDDDPDLMHSELAIVGKKAAAIAATGADLLLAGDLGCLMNMAGKLQRVGANIQVRHIAEVLAGMTHEPAIGMAARASAG